jgi:hypothetical protein
MSNRTFLKALMAYVAGGHLLTGLFCILGRRGVERVGAPLYGAHFDPDAQFSHIVRPAGAFVAGLGLLQLPAVRDPERHKDIIDATLAVLFFRVLQRFLHRREILAVFHISPARHNLTTAHFALLAVLLLLSRLNIKDE